MQPTPIPWLTTACALGAALTLGGCVLLLDYDDYQDAAGAGGQGGEGGAPEPCTPGTTDACYSGDPATENVGVCVGGTRMCRDDGLGYGECAGEITPAAEVHLNLADEDCDAIAGADGEPAWIVGGGAGAPAQRAQGVAFDLLGDIFVTGYREAVPSPGSARFGR